MVENIKQQLEQLQQDNNFPGLERLVKLAENLGINRRAVKKFLHNDIVSQQTKVQHKTKKGKAKNGGHMTAFKENELWNVDIYDMTAWQKGNDGYKYYLVCIDVFTRKAYGEIMEQTRFDKFKGGHDQYTEQCWSQT